MQKLIKLIENAGFDYETDISRISNDEKYHYFYCTIADGRSELELHYNNDPKVYHDETICRFRYMKWRDKDEANADPILQQKVEDESVRMTDFTDELAGDFFTNTTDLIKAVTDFLNEHIELKGDFEKLRKACNEF